MYSDILSCEDVKVCGDGICAFDRNQALRFLDACGKGMERCFSPTTLRLRGCCSQGLDSVSCLLGGPHPTLRAPRKYAGLIFCSCVSSSPLNVALVPLYGRFNVAFVLLYRHFNGAFVSLEGRYTIASRST